MSTNHKPPCVITIGNFDGVHKGHTSLISTTISFAHDIKYRQQFLDTHEKLALSYTSLFNSPPTTLEKMEARIITFSPHPSHILNPKTFTPLMDDETRLLSLQSLGADHINILPFHQILAKQSCEYFCVKLVQDFNMKVLFIGYDFKMGCDQAGSRMLETFGKTYGFCVQALPPVTIDIPTTNTSDAKFSHKNIPSGNTSNGSNLRHEISEDRMTTDETTTSRVPSEIYDGISDGISKSETKNHHQESEDCKNNPSTTPLIISSTHIRKALQNGNIELATRMLGKYFHINGIVEHGAKRGGDLLGFPTANLREDTRILPKNGVYTTLCKILIPKYKDIIFLGVTNIGHNPTFGEFTKSIETHILDFNDNLYDLPMEISFIHFIRDEIKFSSLEELVSQIKADISFSREIFAKL